MSDSSTASSTAPNRADVIDMDLALPRLRAHATAMLLAASAALAMIAASEPHADHIAVLVRAGACTLAVLCAIATWYSGEQFGDVTLAGVVVTVTLLVTVSAAVSHASASNEVMLFLLPSLFAACFLRPRFAVCALIACSAAYGWLVAREASPVTTLLWWTSSTIVLSSAAATVIVLRRELTSALGVLARLAECDPLTGLPNRRSFDQRLARELERCAVAAETCSILMCDLDHFKAINDAHGHAVGDEVLKRVAADLLAGVRAFDTVARVGGEEIAVLLVGCDREAATRIAERLRRHVARALPAEPLVAISIGIADSGLTGEPTELLAHADRALYFAKRSGRDRVCQATADVLEPLVLVT
jgi:diguanylate cyclase (GGDEF)-like protein